MLDRVKGALKWLRASQPLNGVATSAIRGLFHATGIRSELVIRHLHRMGAVRLRLPNGRAMILWSKGDDWVSNQVFWRGWAGYESETIPLFFELARNARATLDVGAFVGYYTLLAAHANPQGSVYAFEPLPTIGARLRRNVEINRVGNVRSIASAVGAVDSVAEFYHIPTEVPTSSSLSHAFMQGKPNLTHTTVPVVRLDRFVQEQAIAAVDLVKIDTESTEPAVLAGMMETIHRDHPNIICEVLAGSGTEGPLEDLLHPCGYGFYHLTPSGPVPRSQIRGHSDWLNYFFSCWPQERVNALWHTATNLPGTLRPQRA
jgi:FkbM family methyltransferase